MTKTGTIITVCCCDQKVSEPSLVDIWQFLRIFAKIKAEAISDDFSSMANGYNIKHRQTAAQMLQKIAYKLSSFRDR